MEQLYDSSASSFNPDFKELDKLYADEHKEETVTAKPM